MHPVEVTIDEQLQHGFWVVGWPTGVVGLRPKTEPRQVQLVDENIDHSDRTVFCNIIIETFGK